MKPGGVYLLRTPHAFTGPHDISKYFSDTPQGFHMKEYTFREIRDLTRRIGFRKVRCVMGVKGKFSVFIPFFYVILCLGILLARRLVGNFFTTGTLYFLELKSKNRR